MSGARPLTTAEIQAIFTKSFPAGAPNSYVRRFYVQTALATGLRVSEILSLHVRNVCVVGPSGAIARDADGHITPLTYILVPKSSLKGGRSVGSNVSSRRITLGEGFQKAAVAYLTDYQAEYGVAPTADSPLFYSPRTGNAVAARTINDALKEIFALAGIADARDGTLGSHCLRKTFAQEVYRASGDNLVLTKEAMNHVSADSTLRYIRPNRARVAELQRDVGESLCLPEMDAE